MLAVLRLFDKNDRRMRGQARHDVLGPLIDEIPTQVRKDNNRRSHSFSLCLMTLSLLESASKVPNERCHMLQVVIALLRCCVLTSPMHRFAQGQCIAGVLGKTYAEEGCRAGSRPLG